jgi:serine/threonine protein phosphatase PrpC
MSSPPNVPPDPGSGEVIVHVVARTDVGRTREHNEDAFAVADLSTEGTPAEADAFTHPAGARGALFMVADGMGGAAAGEIASAMAVEIVVGEMRTNWIVSETADADTFVRSIKQATKSANEHINSFAASHPEYRGMGTTATVAGFLGDTLYLAQVGDSRAYLVRNGAAQQITKDQSLMQKLIEAGELTEEEAAQSERRNIILQALGPEPIIKVDLTHQVVRRGDLLVLCSDGLSGQVTKDEIGVIVSEAPDLAEACKRLIDRANESGGPDNITVIVARFDGSGLQPSATEDEIGHRVFQLPDSGSTPAAAFESFTLDEVTAPFFAGGRPAPGPLRLGESTSKQPLVIDVEPPPPPVIVSPERRNVGQLIALALLALFILAAGWFIVRHTIGAADVPSVSAPKT